MPNTTNCPNCNTDIFEGAIQCSKCGIALADNSTVKPTAHNRKTSPLEILCYAIGGLEVVAAAYVLLNMSELATSIKLITTITLIISSIPIFALGRIMDYLRMLHNKIDTLIEKQK